MNFKGARTLFFVYPALLVLISCSDFGKDRIVYSFEGARGACKEAQFPEWTYPGDVTDWGALTFRRVPGDLSSTILVSRGDTLVTSLNKYRVDLNAPEKVQAIDDSVWKAAFAIPLISPTNEKTLEEPIEPAGDAHDGVRFRGRLFRPSGRYWPNARDFAAIVSPGAKWLALHSQDEERGIGGPITEWIPPPGGFTWTCFPWRMAERC